jgi:hypothetical protein
MTEVKRAMMWAALGGILTLLAVISLVGGITGAM